MIRIAVDLFLLEPGQYVAVSGSWPVGAEFASVRDMIWPGPEREIPPDAVLIRDMDDPDEIAEREERERRQRGRALLGTYDPTAHIERMMRKERAERRRALKNAADASVFWLPNITENDPDDPEGRHWYPFSGPPPERQQWLVWREMKAAQVAYLAWPESFVPPHFLSTNLPQNVRLARVDEPAEAVAYALARVRHLYRTMPYPDYLKTPHWLRTRDDAVTSAGHCCEECGNYFRVLDAHHLTYERRGAELPEDLRVLCRDCHMKLHDDLPKGGQ